MIAIDDIYCAAYLSASGLKIVDIAVNRHSKGEKDFSAMRISSMLMI